MRIFQARVPAIAVVVLGLVAVGLTVGVVWERVAAARLASAIMDEQEKLTDARKDLRECLALREDYSDLSMKLGGRLPECTWSDQMPFMVAQLTGIVEGNGLRIETLRPEPMTSKSGILRFPLGIEIQMDIAHLKDILEDIESTVPLLDIERLDVRPAQGDPGRLQVSMRVASFVVLDKQASLTRRRATSNIVATPEKETVTAEEAETDSARSPEVRASPGSGRRSTVPAARPGAPGGER